MYRQIVWIPLLAISAAAFGVDALTVDPVGNTLMTGDVTASKNLTVMGLINANSTLTVTGAVTTNSDVAVGRNLTVAGTTNVTGSLSSGGDIVANRNISVVGSLTANGAINANADIVGGRNLTVAGAINLNGEVVASKNISVTGVFNANGDIAANKNIAVVGFLNVNGKINANSDIVANKNVTVSGSLTSTGVITGQTAFFSNPISAPNFPSFSSVVNIGASISLPGDGSVAGKFYKISGVKTDYLVMLPSAATIGAGAVVAFSVAPYDLANKQYFITPISGQNIDGRANGSSLVLVHTNFIVLVSDGIAGWTSIAKKVDTDWVSAGTVPIAAVTTSPTKGVATRDSMIWRRIGDSAEVVYTYFQTTGGAHGSGDYLFGLPSGLKIELSKIATSANDGVVGADIVGLGFYTGVYGLHYPAAFSVTAYNDVRLRFYISGTVVGGFAAGFVGTSFIALGTPGHGYSARIMVPIKGW